VKHPMALALAAVPVCVGLALSAGPTFAGTTATKSTTFAFRTSGFGTREIGGQAPASSGTTAYQVIGCTNRSGKHRENDVGQAAVPGLGTVTDSRTKVWTTAKNGVVASHSRHSISQVVVASTGLGSLAIDGITSTSTASHDSDGFHAVTSTRIGSLTFTPPTGPAQSFAAPTPDQPVTIPGLATVYAGQHVTQLSGNGAVASAFALRVDIVPSGTSVRVARSHAQLNAGLTGGIFGGHSAATHVVSAAGGIAKGGPDPLTLMPCQGTYGKVREKRQEAGRNEVHLEIWVENQWGTVVSPAKAVVLLPTFTNHGNSLVPLAVIALGLLLYIYFHPGVRSRRAAPAAGDGAGDGDQDPADVGADVVELAPRRESRGGG